MLYVARTYINNKSLALVIPAMLARANKLAAGMAMLLETRDDGSIIIHPPAKQKEMLEAMRKQAQATAKHVEDNLE